METLYDCVVVANGSFPQTAGPLELLKATPVIIACDGAVQNLHERGLVPSAIVGDLDSIPSEMLRLYADRIHTVEDQEINDLTKAVRFAHASGYRKILILGATGTSRRPYTRKYLPADRLCSSIRSRGNALRLRSLHPRPPDNNATMHTRPANIHLFHISLRRNNHRRPPMAHHPTAPDILVARSLNEALGTEFTLTLSPDARLIIYFQSPA